MAMAPVLNGILTPTTKVISCYIPFITVKGHNYHNIVQHCTTKCHVPRMCSIHAVGSRFSDSARQVRFSSMERLVVSKLWGEIPHHVNWPSKLLGTSISDIFSLLATMESHSRIVSTGTLMEMSSFPWDLGKFAHKYPSLGGLHVSLLHWSQGRVNH